MHNYQSLTKYEKINFFLQIVQALISLIGIVGNLLAICVFSRKRLNKCSYSCYFRVLACLDIILLTHGFKRFVANIFDVDIEHISPLLCAFNEYQPYVAGLASTWMHTVILIDRLFFIQYRNQLVIFRKRWFQALLVSIVIVYSLIVHSILPLNFKLVDVLKPSGQNSLLVTKACQLPDDVIKVNSGIVFANIALNVLINSVLQLKLISFILRSRRRTRHWAHHSRLLTDRDHKFIVSIVALNLISFVSRIPFAIGVFLWPYLNMSPDQIQMMFTISVMFSFCNSGTLFFVNILVNSVFYKEFTSMIGLSKSYYIL